MKAKDRSLVMKWLHSLNNLKLIKAHGITRSRMIDDLLSEINDDTEKGKELLEEAKKWRMDERNY